jgi:hypothetical protein
MSEVKLDLGFIKIVDSIGLLRIEIKVCVQCLVQILRFQISSIFTQQ